MEVHLYGPCFIENKIVPMGHDHMRYVIRVYFTLKQRILIGVISEK